MYSVFSVGTMPRPRELYNRKDKMDRQNRFTNAANSSFIPIIRQIYQLHTFRHFLVTDINTN